MQILKLLCVNHFASRFLLHFVKSFICLHLFRRSGQDTRQIAQKFIRIITLTNLQTTAQTSGPVDIAELYLSFFNSIILMFNAMQSHLRF